MSPDFVAPVFESVPAETEGEETAPAVEEDAEATVEENTDAAEETAEAPAADEE